jgi:integrase
MNTHRGPARQPASCIDCLAWGDEFIKGLCGRCLNFSRKWPLGQCATCQRRLPVKKGHCRLCWHQALLDRDEDIDDPVNTPLLPYVRRVRHQQLVLGHMLLRVDLVGAAARPVRSADTVGACRQRQPWATHRPAIDWVQPPLFDHSGRDYTRVRIDLRTRNAADNPWLTWAWHLANSLAEARGFEDEQRANLNHVLAMLLTHHTAGETIRLSDVVHILRERGTGAVHTAAHVLQEMGVLADDQPRAFDTWLDGQLRGITPAIAHQVRRWALALHDGGPRIKARHDKTVRIYIATARPVLLSWSARHEHLREISRDDLLTQIAPLRGWRRQRTITALRSLFGWAKTSGVIFRNPTTRIKLPPTEQPARQPLTPTQIAPTLQAATAAHIRLAVVLAAVHAARSGDIVKMQLTDIDLGERRLTIAGRTRPLDELTRSALNDWLTYRRQQWPNTANPHLIISKRSAPGLKPASQHWISRVLRGLPANLEHLRVDRQLDEAIMSGADPLHLAEVFGIGRNTALRYATSARQLLHSTIEDHPGHREPPDSR